MTINYKVFAAGDTLSANDVLTYLENQAVIKVDAASELPTLASTYPNVKVAYAADTDKVYVNDDGTFVALVTADGTVSLSNLTLTGNLTVQGTTTTIDSTTIAIKDKFVFEGATVDAHETTLQVVEPTADRTISLPDSSGTVALTSDIPSVASFITASSTEPLTNKTINLASNTLTTTLAQLNTAISDENVVSRDGIETLTNKTISGASNTLTNIGNGSLTNSSITINGTPVSLGGTASISSYSLPSQTGNSGKFLTTNGTTDSWGTVDLTTKTDKATLTTTGDIYYASSASTPARLGIGSAGQVLTVASGIPSWATPAAGGGGGGSLTLLQTLTLSGTNSVTTSTFSSGYTNLMILFVNLSTGSGGNLDGNLRFNGDSSSNYILGGVNGQDSQAAGEGSAHTQIPVISVSNDSNNNGMQIVNVFRYNDSARKLITSHGYGGISGGGNSRYRFLMGAYKGGAITNFTFARLQLDHSFNTGTIYIYGVN